MAHYAFLDENNIVTEVIVGKDETESIEGLEPEIWYGNFRNQVCKRTSFNNNIRKRYASPGYSYDPVLDIFLTPQPYPSWTVSSEELDWVAPTPKPDSGFWTWNEEALVWEEHE